MSPSTSSPPVAQRAAETIQYVYGRAVAADDADGVLANAYRPHGLTVLLVYSDAKAEVRQEPRQHLPVGAGAERTEVGQRRNQHSSDPQGQRRRGRLSAPLIRAPASRPRRIGRCGDRYDFYDL